MGGMITEPGGEWFAAAFAPDVFGQFWHVDERIAVVLEPVDGFVAVHFLLAHRVHAVPLHQQVDGPVVEGGVVVLAHHVCVLPGEVLVACGHVEIGACEVAFVFIVRLEYARRIAALSSHGVSYTAYSVVEFYRLVHVDGAEGVVAFRGVRRAFRRIEVVEVDIRSYRFGASPPAFGEGVLAVEAGERRRVERDVGIHVPPPPAVGIDVGDLEIAREVVVGRHSGEVFDDVVHGGLQVAIGFAVEAAVVSRGDFGHGAQCSECRNEQQPAS